MFEAQKDLDPIALHPDEDKLARQFAGEQGPEGDGVGQESLGDQGLGGYGTDAQQGFDPDTGGPTDPGSNWLAFEGLSQEELGGVIDVAQHTIGLEDREDNGQSGPTQDNGGLGYGDEEGLGRTGLTEAGAIGQSDTESSFEIEEPNAKSSVKRDPAQIDLDAYFSRTLAVPKK